tara:strand:- start:112 stop:321 length:210 start_codon:yes stop_codon:yes gene_type:complete
MKHLKENNESYISHMLFAGKIGIYLSLVSTFFVIHSLFPFVKIPKDYNLEALKRRVDSWNKYSKERLKK